MDGSTGFGALTRGETPRRAAHGDTNRRASCCRRTEWSRVESRARYRYRFMCRVSRWARSSYPTRAPQHSTAKRSKARHGTGALRPTPTLFLLFLPSNTERRPGSASDPNPWRRRFQRRTPSVGSKFDWTYMDIRLSLHDQWRIKRNSKG